LYHPTSSVFLNFFSKHFMIESKYFFLNGQQYFTKAELTLLDLITYFNYTTSLFVLEYNGSVCHKKSWNKIPIKTNDKIEIVTIVGGG
jgi:sulfur carrier protein